MPIFHVVQCFDCSQFQSVQARKDKKFSCKLCGKKQSVRKIIARSESGAEVRKVVQRLNLARGTAQEAYEEKRADEFEYDETYKKEPEEVHSLVDPSQSRWRELAQAADVAERKYEYPLETGEEDVEEDEFVTAVPDLKTYSKGRGRRQAASGPRRRVGESAEFPAAGGVGKRSRQNVNASKRLNGGYANTKNSREPGCDPTPPVTKYSARRSGSAYANFGEDNEGFFTTAGADVAFEEEVMP